MTCSNGEGSGVVVPGTGVHVNNMMGEDDLNPRGFHTYPPGRRLPSMMAPTVVVGPDGVELVVGSAGSNRIRSAILQTIVGVVDHGWTAQQAIDAPRVHLEDGMVFAEPGVDLDALRGAGGGHAVPRPQPVLRRRPGRAARRAHRRDVRRGRPRRGGAVVPHEAPLPLLPPPPRPRAGRMRLASADLFVVHRTGSTPAPA